mmetsp:Transcript_12647/g.28843  ORF Transcript_12647/g.28843 Transcript_12647/m.28843 type:complete len:479 (-) Transcript_12647:127-1563(-)|eukprot:CAMPEP_0204311560 /NCGR_PEP_ID=MMETSP0469-20131031/2414_1 /ASSEMBLY_ACC=CAM_ASM_000384 /TAXON_ID=2969 /ORGANISM="Oxyrrhis marina" /LENGTH=478 /DNA_ID=CAMNT_0051291529 /DNA_START=19 /DNA_END=1455 /DNA_ORIENTATION=-
MKREFSSSDGGGKRARKADSTVLRILVPQDAVSAVVGSKGSHIRKMRESGCDIQMMDTETPHEIASSGYKILQVAGEGDRSHVLALVFDAYAVAMRVSDPLAQHQLVMIEPDRACGAIIGPKGSTVSDISESTRTKIHVEKMPYSANLRYRRLEVSGTVDDIIMAVDRVRQAVADGIVSGKITDDLWELHLPARGQARGSHPPPPAQFVERRPPPVAPPPPRPAPPAHRSEGGQRMYGLQLLLTPDQAGLVVGQRGSYIKELRSHGPEVEIDTPPAAPNDRVLTLAGPSDCVRRCLPKVVQKLFPRSGAEIPTHVLVPAEKFGLIMGIKGAMIQQIERETRVSLKKGDHFDEWRTLMVTGPEDCVVAALAIINDVLQQDVEDTGRRPRAYDMGRPEPPRRSSAAQAHSLPILLPSDVVVDQLQRSGMLEEIAHRSRCRIRIGQEVVLESTYMTALYLAGTSLENSEAVRILQDYLGGS